MFLKRVWTLEQVQILFDCPKDLEPKMNKMYINTSTLKENQIKVEKHLTDLAKLIFFK